MRTHYIILTCLLLLLGDLVTAQQQIYFSKYVEGSGYDKALEIYNATDRNINLGDYKIEVDTDGKGFDSNQRVSSFQLKGFLAPRTSYLMVREVSTNEELKFLADTTLRSNILNFNGNEQIRLLEIDRRDGREYVLDQIGYPGSSNNMKDMTLVRKSQNAPNLGRVGSLTSEWIKKSYNDLSCLKLAPGSTNLGGTIDKTKTVGSIPGSASVSLTGAATYSVPIPVLPGINGLSPNITVNYNSQGGNGLLGKAWNLSGLSAIKRIPQTIYHDGKTLAVNMNSDDRFALDGSRLMAINGTYGASNTEYRTEAETYSKITAHGSGLSAYFKVETKDGRILEYGHSDNSKIKLSGESQVLMWYLNKVTDINGNTIVYNYQQSGGSSWINNIQYGVNTIQFRYGTYRNPISVMIKGHKITTNKILNYIDVKCDNKTLYGYRLGYYKNSAKNIDELQSITKYNGVGQELNKTSITWGKEDTSLSKPQRSSINVEEATFSPDIKKQYFCSMDTDNDGISELVSFYDQKLGTRLMTAKQSYVPSIQNNKLVGMTKKSSWTYGESNLGWLEHAMFSDVFESGKKEIIYPVYLAASPARVMFRLIEHNGKVFLSSGLDKKVEPIYATNDINNNNRDDIVLLQTGTNKTGYYKGEIYEHKTTVANFENPEITAFELHIPNNEKPEHIIINDFSSDGLKDILVITNKCGYVYKGDGVKFSKNYIYSSTELKEGQLLKQGDFNSDGVIDLLISHWDGNSLIRFAYGNGKGGFDIKTYSDIVSINDDRTKKDNDKDNCIIADFNNDGRSDFILFNGTYTHKWDLGGSYYRFRNFVVSYYQSTGTGFRLVNTKTVGSEEYSKSKYFVTGDFDGDGRLDILNYGYGLFGTGGDQLGWHMYGSSNKDFAEGLVTEIKDGFNANLKFGYEPLTSGEIYTKGNVDNVNIHNFQGPMYVATSLELPNGLGGHIRSSYKYKGALVHKKGKGFLGFRETEVTNQQTNQVELRFNELNSKYFTLALKKIEVKTIGGLRISSSENINLVKDLGGKRFMPYVSKQVKNDAIKGVDVTQEYIYDDYGNLTKQTTKYGQDAISVVNNIYTTAGSWCPSRLAKSTVNKTYTNEPVYISTTNYKYYSNGNLEYDQSNGVRTTYTYDSYGNPDIVKASVSGESDRIIDYDYDPTHRFVSKKTDPLGQIETFQYNAWGNVTKHVDIGGNKSYNIYDDWGALFEVQHPDGLVSDYNTHWADDNNYGALYYTYSKDEDAAFLKIYYDILGRKLITETEGFNGKVYTGVKYNSKGLVSKKLSSHYKGGMAILSDLSYDYLGRMQAVSVNGVESTFTYSGLKTTTKSPNGVSSKVFNTLGNVVAATDNGGTISYKYHSSGQAKSITSNGSTVNMTYYPDGKQKTLRDPDAGTITYIYNGWGELKTQTDGNGNSTSIKYDKSGRITQKTCGSLVSDYTYYTTGKQIGLLQKVTSSNNTSTSYSYNSFAQPIVIVESIQGKVFRTSYSYDDYGRVNSIAYPSGFTVTQHYNTNGYLTEVKRADNGKSIWKAGSVEANGQVKSFVSGNGKWTHKTFDNDGYLTGIKTDYGRLQNLSYKFDKEKGNLLERRDIRNGSIERFTYDNLNRLTSSKFGTETQSFQYDKNGNITFKSMVGDYDYDSTKPHAVTGISNDDGLVKKTQHIDYTAFNKVSQIVQDPCRMNFVYGHDFARRKTDLFKDNSKVMTKYFVGNYEQKEMGSRTQKISYIMGGDGLAAIHVAGDGLDQLVYPLKDHLGSIVGIGYLDGVVDERIFDSWGKPRHAEEIEDFAYNEDLSYQDLCRGYTGHEHLPEFGLINMNGRVYDPLLGRFLSPDNFVQNSNFTQNFNRFGYCYNNPLKNTDPSGQFIITGTALAVAAVFGASINVLIQGYQGNINSPGDFLKSALVGGAAGAAGYIAGGLVAGSYSALATNTGAAILQGGAAGAAGGFAGGLVGGAGNAWTNGASFGEGLKQGIITGGMGALGGAIIGGLVSGIQFQRQTPTFRQGCENLGVKAGKPVPKTDKFLKDAQKAWFKDAPMDKVKNFTVEKLTPKRLSVLKNNDAFAQTTKYSRAKILTGRSSVYFNPEKAFSSARTLFVTMGHEFNHVSQYALLAGVKSSFITSDFVNLMEYHAYSYQDHIGGSKLNSFTPGVVRGLAKQFPNYFNAFHYSNFKWTQTVNFTSF